MNYCLRKFGKCPPAPAKKNLGAAVCRFASEHCECCERVLYEAQHGAVRFCERVLYVCTLPGNGPVCCTRPSGTQFAIVASAGIRTRVYLLSYSGSRWSGLILCCRYTTKFWNCHQVLELSCEILQKSWRFHTQQL